jgi:hypothetical protein
MTMKKNNNLKFLSRSILFEEQGIPNIYKISILAVTIMIISFIIWSSQVIINEKITVNGYAEKDLFVDIGYDFIALVPSRNISEVRQNNSVFLSISGITNKNKISAYVSKIDKKPIRDSYGKTYYKVTITPAITDTEKEKLKLIILDRMETSSEIVLREKTLLQYLLGPLWDARVNTIY